jgi:hypothetical protein
MGRKKPERRRKNNMTNETQNWSDALKSAQAALGMDDAAFQQFLMQDTKNRLAGPVGARIRGLDGRFLPTGKRHFRDLRDAQERSE